MRRKKAAGLTLAALAACGALAVWVVVPALAVFEQTNICSTNEAVCHFEHLVAGAEGETITSTAEAVKPSFTGGFEEKCTASTATSIGSNVNVLSIEKLSLSGCTPCAKATASGLPAKGEGFPTSGGNAEVVVPIKFIMSECSFGATCTFGASGRKLEATGSATAPAVVAKAVELPFIEGNKTLCGSSLKWNATYKIVSAVEKYVEPAEGAVTLENDLPVDGFVEAKSEE